MARFAMLIAIVCASACGKPPTTALIRIDASPRATLTAVYGRVALGSAAPGPEQQIKSGQLQLPGTIDVWLPDVAQTATVTLRALTTDGQTLTAVAELQVVPHREVLESVMLMATGPNGGGGLGGVDGGLGGLDGGVGDPPSDGGTTPSPDLATGTTPTPDMATSNVIAADTFHRAANQALWGTASDGHTWNVSADAASYAIANNIGLVVGQSGDATAELGPAVADADLVVTGSFSTLVDNQDGNNELAAMLRWNSDNNFYKAGMDGQNFRLYVRTSATKSITFSTVPFAANANTSYSIRFRAVGTALMAKVWLASATEPATWMVTTTDASIASGAPGIRLVFNSPSTASFTSFVASKP